MKDKDKMPFGAYKEKEMQDVPASYLIWLYDNNKCFGGVKKYIEENLETLRLEVKQKIKK